MRARPAATAVSALLLAALPCLPLPAQRTIEPHTYLMSDRTAEVALARSAAPDRISDSATVLVLTEGGYVRAASGTDGFTCLVVRSFTAPLNDPDFGNPRIIAPHCFNAQASRTTLREILQRSAWIMHGVPAAEVAARTRRWYAAGRFPAPAPGAMAYMLSREQSLSAQGSHWLPHVMFFHDQRQRDGAAFGAGDPPAAPLLVAADDPDTPVMTLLIPVRRWSDGTPAPADSPQSNPVTSAARRMAQRSGLHLIDAALAMPADKYGWQPTRGQMTFGELIVHVQGDNRATCSSFSGMTPAEEPKLSATAPKAALVAALSRSISFCDSALAKVSDAKLGEPVSWYGTNTTRVQPMLGLLTDWADHYGQQAMYLRLNGILPPTARK